MVAYLKNVPFLIFDSILFDRRILRVYCIRCWVYLSIHTSWQIPSKVFVMCVDLCVYTTRRDFHPRCNSCTAPVVVVFCAPLPADSIRFRQGRVSNMTRALVVCLPVWCEKTSRDDPDSLIKSPQWRPPNPPTHTHTHTIPSQPNELRMWHDFSFRPFWSSISFPVISVFSPTQLPCTTVQPVQ
jgi:hypothetical protein